MKNFNLEKRKFVIAGSVVFIVLAYILRLFALQIVSEDYKQSADSNAFLNQIQYPSRGVIYDRNGELLVYNQPAYDVMVLMREVENLDTLEFCKSLSIDKEYFIKRMAEIKDRNSNPGYSSYTQQVFISQLSVEEASAFRRNSFFIRVFLFRKGLFVSMLQRMEHMSWVMLLRFLKETWKRMIITCVEIILGNRV